MNTTFDKEERDRDSEKRTHYSGVVLGEILGDHCKSGPKCEFFLQGPF